MRVTGERQKIPVHAEAHELFKAASAAVSNMQTVRRGEGTMGYPSPLQLSYASSQVNQCSITILNLVRRNKDIIAELDAYGVELGRISGAVQ